MEDFYMNITSWDNSYDYSNITYNYSNITSNYSNITSNYSNISSNYSNITYDYYDYSNITYYYDYSFYEHYLKVLFIMDVVTYVIISVGLFLTPIAIYALYSQVRNDHVAPIYVINLLISDIIQLCCLTTNVTPNAFKKINKISYCVYFFALMASVGFMVCIALERYLVIAHPLWYRCRRNIKISVVVCVLVWVVPLVSAFVFLFSVDHQVTAVVFSIIIFLPLPLFMFFVGGTLKALSASISVPSDEKRRIVAVLVLVLLIYTLLFLPAIIWYLVLGTTDDYDFRLFSVSSMFLRFSPLADLILYVFMRKGTVDKLLSSVCCCRMDSDDTNSPSV